MTDSGRPLVPALALACALSLGCAPAAAQTDAPDRLVRECVARLQAGDLDGVRQMVLPEMLPNIEHKALLLLSHALERLPDSALWLVHREALVEEDGSESELLAYQLRGGGEAILLLAKLRTREARPWIAHIEWQPAPLDLRERFPFELAGMPPPFYLVLAAAVAVPIVMLVALVACWRRRPRLALLWSAFILLGVGRLTVIWLPLPYHPSYLRAQPLQVQLLGVRFEKSPPYDPWRISVSAPVGALAFLCSRRRRAAGRPAGASTAHASGGGRSREPAWLLALAGLGLVVSGWAPYDRATWILEVLPVVVGAVLLVATRGRFPLTPLVYRLLFLHAVILLVGGHYTYARVPLGHWLQDLLELSRNHYDRLGHFAQGFVPALLAREILLRRSPLVPGGWTFFLVLCVCLAFSACYEFLEWWAALVGGESAAAFLGTQGDVWDTQWDMLLALLGAASAQVLLGRAHDRALRDAFGPGASGPGGAAAGPSRAGAA